MSNVKTEKLILNGKTLAVVAMSDSDSLSCTFGKSFDGVPEQFATLLNFEYSQANPERADSEFIAQEYEERCLALRSLAKAIPDSVIV